MFYNIKLTNFALAFGKEHRQRSGRKTSQRIKSVKKVTKNFVSSKTCRTFAKFSAREKGQIQRTLK